MVLRSKVFFPWVGFSLFSLQIALAADLSLSLNPRSGSSTSLSAAPISPNGLPSSLPPSRSLSKYLKPSSLSPNPSRPSLSLFFSLDLLFPFEPYTSIWLQTKIPHQSLLWYVIPHPQGFIDCYLLAYAICSANFKFAYQVYVTMPGRNFFIFFICGFHFFRVKRPVLSKIRNMGLIYSYPRMLHSGVNELLCMFNWLLEVFGFWIPSFCLNSCWEKSGRYFLMRKGLLGVSYYSIIWIVMFKLKNAWTRLKDTIELRI